MAETALSQLKICIKGAGEMASGIACRLYSANLKQIVMLDIAKPMAVRRKVAFSEAVYDGLQTVEEITAKKAARVEDISTIWSESFIAVQVDPEWDTLKAFAFDVVIDAILAKKNLGTQLHDAPLVIGMGPGFIAGADVHFVIETNRGHNLGRVINEGSAEPNTGIPGKIGDYANERVLRSPADGIFSASKTIGDSTAKGDSVGNVNGQEIHTEIAGVIRGLIRNKIQVKKGLKLGDIDPRNEKLYCNSISEKARAIGGSVLEVIVSRFG